MEVPISEVTPHPDPGRQYVGWADGVLQVHDGGGGSRATTAEAGGGEDDARTGLGDADSDGASLAMEAEIGAELTGSESRADVGPTDESRWVWRTRWATYGSKRRRMAGSAASLSQGKGFGGEWLGGGGRVFCGAVRWRS